MDMDMSPNQVGRWRDRLDDPLFIPTDEESITRQKRHTECLGSGKGRPETLFVERPSCNDIFCSARAMCGACFHPASSPLAMPCHALSHESTSTSWFLSWLRYPRDSTRCDTSPGLIWIPVPWQRAPVAVGHRVPVPQSTSIAFVVQNHSRLVPVIFPLLVAVRTRVGRGGEVLGLENS